LLLKWHGREYKHTDESNFKIMAKPLKDNYDQTYLRRLSKEIAKAEPAFPSQKMLKFVFDREWEQKELKQRMRHITRALKQFLPQDYGAALNVLKQAAPQFGGFEAMFLPDIPAANLPCGPSFCKTRNA
jgi:3-methyladenine DNA glycosylase AlkC